jgi:hypothetical protein
LVGAQSAPTPAMYESAKTNRSALLRLVFALSYIAAAAFGNPIERPLLFVIFVPFVVKL